MSDQKLSPKFPPDQKPWERGLYRIGYLAGQFEGYSYWNGEYWGYRTPNRHAAEYHKFDRALGPIDWWRGLAEKPE